MGYVLPPPAVSVLRVAGTADIFPVNRIFCVGRNYTEHAREMGHDPDRTRPCFFMKPATAVLPEGNDFPYPSHSENVHYECELVVALGRDGSNIPISTAQDHIYGYAVGLDMTRRDLQAQAGKKGEPWEVAKSFDASAPCSAIMPVVKIGHPTKSAISLELNGRKVQASDISHLIWDVPHIIHFLSGLFTLAAGDLIFTGTPAGVGPVHRGDVLHGKIDNIGELTVRVS